MNLLLIDDGQPNLLILKSTGKFMLIIIPLHVKSFKTFWPNLRGFSKFPSQFFLLPYLGFVPFDGSRDNYSEVGRRYQRVVGHVSLVLQLQQPSLQFVPRSLCLLTQLLLPLQTPSLHLEGVAVRLMGERSATLRLSLMRYVYKCSVGKSHERHGEACCGLRLGKKLP